MTTPAIASLEKLLGGPRDGALLRYSIGNEYLKLGDSVKASAYLREAVARDPQYSAAWKQLGKALTDSGEVQAALAAYEMGIEVATGKGDVQAAKEMGVFRKRLEKRLAEPL